MPIAYKTLYHGLIGVTTVVTLYTAPALTEAVLSKIRFKNNSTSASVSVNIYITPTSGTAEATSNILETILLGPGESAVLKGPEELAPGETIKVVASVASILTIRVSGGEKTA